ncbi:MAG: hypothetical protein LDLANPLL_02282 [Turneriella sp.]|nr:hypothetical protein [Turneriella sp.]
MEISKLRLIHALRSGRFTIRAKLLVITLSIALVSITGLSYAILNVLSIRTQSLIQGLVNNTNRSLKSSLENEISLLRQKADMVDMLMVSNKNVASKILQSETEIFYASAYEKLQKRGLNQIYEVSQVDRFQIQETGLQNAVKAQLAHFEGLFSINTTVFNISHEVKKPALLLVHPIVVGKKARRIVLIGVAGQKLDTFFEVDKFTTSFLLDKQNQLILHKNSKLMLDPPKAVSLPKEFSDHENMVGKFMKVNYKGEEVFLSAQKLSDAELLLITTIPVRIALETLTVIRVRSILITIMILIVTAVIVYFFARSLSKPMVTLARATDKIIEGDFGIRLKPRGNDEVTDLTTAFNIMAHGLEEREKLKGALAKFVNPEIAAKALRGEIQLGGERKNATIFFSDIRSFTSISEKLEPEQIVEFLNEYMTIMVKIINRHGGMVDKFIGDAIMALWGLPDGKPNDLENCLRACLQMRKELAVFNKGRGTKDKPTIDIGIGVNYGGVLAGQIGSDDRLEYTVIGDAVNLASRIEGLNKDFKTDILVSESVYEKTNTLFNFEAKGGVKVKGKSVEAKIFALIDEKTNGTYSKR